ETKSKNIIVISWIIRLILSIIFTLAAYLKFSGSHDMILMFNIIGVGQWFRLVTGAIELLGAIFLMIPKLTGFGSVLIMGVMAGAIAAHLYIIGGSFTFPLALLLTSMLELFISRKKIQKAFDRTFYAIKEK
ncbi:MAG: DoxX family protein, partial [Bdellovibrionales bacterium]|nr:DoxX family protein [Bdellovibrionales bacterium]